MSIATLLAMTSIPAQALDDGLVYVAVDPCRIVDTRNTGGAIPADTSRNFLVSGTSGQLAVQGGSTDCLNPRAGSKPLAISAYVLAVPPVSGSIAGVLTAFPAGDPDPAVGAGSTVNFAAGQVIGNTTTITLCDPTGSCPTNGEFAILSRLTNQEVVVDVQGYYYPAAGSCSDDMVAAGSVCIDKYEASIWDAASGGTQIPASTCLADGSDCGAGAVAAFPIYAQSVAGVAPAAQVSWYQAAQACANVGKRLPTTAEWQMAASGTPAGVDDGTNGCNTNGVAPPLFTDASNATCVSASGARDMVGNLWEWTAELTGLPTGGGFTFEDTDNANGRILGGSYNSGTSNSTQDVATVGAGPSLANNGEIGFRCAR